MKKFLFALCAVTLLFASCDRNRPDDPDKPVTGEISVACESPLTLGVGQTFVLSPVGFSWSQADAVSSDMEVVSINNGVLTAHKLGQAVITITLKSDNTKTCSVTVNVVDMAGSTHFITLAYNYGEGEPFTIYRYRFADMRENFNDKNLTKNDDYFGMDADSVINVHFPEPGEWLHIKDVTASDGVTTLEAGIFRDSVVNLTIFILSKDLFFDDEGYLKAARDGALFLGSTYVWYDPVFAHAVLWSNHQFSVVDDMTAYDNIRKPDVDPKPYTDLFQAGHFNAENYQNFYQAALSEEEPKREDYPYYGDDDSKLYICFTDEEGTYQLDWGYPVAGDDPEQVQFQVGVADNSYVLESYNFDAMVWPRYDTYGLKTEVRTNEDGQEGEYYVDPVEVMDFERVTFSGTNPVDPTPARANRLPQHLNDTPIPVKALDASRNVYNTVGATLKMFIDQYKR